MKPTDIVDIRENGCPAAFIAVAQIRARVDLRPMKPSIAPSLNAVCWWRKPGGLAGHDSDGLDSYRLIAGGTDGLPGVYVTIDRLLAFVLQLIQRRRIPARRHHQRPEEPVPQTAPYMSQRCRRA